MWNRNLLQLWPFLTLADKFWRTKCCSLWEWPFPMNSLFFCWNKKSLAVRHNYDFQLRFSVMQDKEVVRSAFGECFVFCRLACHVQIKNCENFPNGQCEMKCHKSDSIVHWQCQNIQQFIIEISISDWDFLTCGRRFFNSFGTFWELSLDTFIAG